MFRSSTILSELVQILAKFTLLLKHFSKIMSFCIMWRCGSMLPQLHIIYEGHLESKERFAIKKYLLIVGKKKNMQVLSHTFTYFFT